MLKIKKKAQSTVEYATVLILVGFAFLAFGPYLKRAIQGKFKTATDQIGDQYDPRTANTRITHRSSGIQTMVIMAENAGTNRWTSRVDSSDMTETKTGYSVMGAYEY